MPGMRPSAAPFSPSFSSSDYASVTTANLAVVPYSSVNGSTGGVSSDCNSTPRDLILHESIRGLIHDVEELRTRCDGLQAANDGVKKDLQVIERRQSKAAKRKSAVNRRPKLIDYESSDTSSEPETQPEKEKDSTGRDAGMEMQIQTMGKILEAFNESLQKEAAARGDLEKKLERTQFDATAVKGRVGKCEKKYKDLDAEVAELNVATAEKKGNNDHFVLPANTTNDQSLSAYFHDEIDQLHSKVKIALTDIQELSHDINAQGADITKLQRYVNQGKVNTGSSGDGGGGWPTSPKRFKWNEGKASSDGTSQMQQEIERLKVQLCDMTRRAELEQKIDDAPTRDTLHGMYHQLDRAMNTMEISSSVRCKAGEFIGTFDELFALRDRVLRRLAVFDLCGKALAEAKAADVVI